MRAGRPVPGGPDCASIARMPERERRWNGWGFAGESYPVPAAARAWLAERLGAGDPLPATAESEIAVPPPRPLPALPAPTVTAPAARLRAACGHSLPDLLALRTGAIAAFPDAVCLPESRRAGGRGPEGGLCGRRDRDPARGRHQRGGGRDRARRGPPGGGALAGTPARPRARRCHVPVWRRSAPARSAPRWRRRSRRTGCAWATSRSRSSCRPSAAGWPPARPGIAPPAWARSTSWWPGWRWRRPQGSGGCRPSRPPRPGRSCAGWSSGARDVSG